MARPAVVSLLVLFGLPALLLFIVPRAALLCLAGILLAIAVRGAGETLARVLRLPDWAGMALVVIATLGVLGFGARLAAPTLAQQADELLQQMPIAWAGLRDMLQSSRWGRTVLEEFAPGDLISSVGTGAASMAAAAARGTAGWMTDAIYLLFLGMFLAASPAAYLAGLKAMVAPSLRQHVDPVLAALGRALRAWVAAQLLAMTIVGGLTFLGLSLLGMPLAGILAAAAALLGFIPILGPIIAAIPALLLALGEGWSMVLWVAGLYVLIQTIEGDIVTPLVQSRAIRLPPGLILIAQLVMLSLFGLFGLAMAAPLAAVLLVLTQQLYVDGYLAQASAPARGGAGDIPAGKAEAGNASRGPSLTKETLS